MEPIPGGGGPSPPRPSDRRVPAPDIEVTPFDGALPLSRGAPERALRRKDHYRRRARVTDCETLTSTGTVLISLRVVDDEPFDAVPGYFVGIRADLGGLGVRRSPYCLSSPPNDERTFRLLVRRVPDGPVSVFLADLAAGDVIEFRGPSGRSMVPKAPDHELVLLATGVGIGPLLALLGHILPAGFDRSVRLYWGLRQVEDVCLVDELERLGRSFPNFGYAISLSQPPAGWRGLRGRLTESVPPLLRTLGGKQYYLVGNGAMIEEVAAVLSDLGVDTRCVHQEAYFNVKYRPDPHALADIRRRFVASDLFSPYAHQEAGGFLPERPVSRGRPAE